jgi:circadian clock protein KaiC
LPRRVRASKPDSPRHAAASGLKKVPTGITGLDEITLGGLPFGRTTLVAGGAGCGKTLLGMEFLVQGALQFNEPGAFIAFEETAQELTENMRSVGYGLEPLVKARKLVLDYIRIERSEIEETGDYDLEGLFVRLAHAIDSIGAKRVVLDTLEVLFAGLKDHGILRAELRRLFRWLKDRHITAIVTAESGPDGKLSRHGIEEYVSDCVIALDHRISQQISTRRLRIVKYRGSGHGANEYPFLIDDGGLVVFPITSLGLDYHAPRGHIASGVTGLDAALDGRGFFRGSSVLVTGTAGTGKTSVAAQFADAACARGERCLYFSMEESPEQIVRNMRSIGLNLERWRKAGLLELHSARPTLHGLETHLATVYRAVSQFEPRIVIMDPLTGFAQVGSDREVTAAITRLLDFLKAKQITALFTTLVSMQADPEHSEVGVSSWMDTWLLLRTLESAGLRRRALYVIKSRGMSHSDRIHELQFSSRGIRVLPGVAMPEAPEAHL